MISDLIFIEIYYGGETHSVEQPQSFTCPLCGDMGFTDGEFRDHVTRQHADSSTAQEVVSHKTLLFISHINTSLFHIVYISYLSYIVCVCIHIVGRGFPFM